MRSHKKDADKRNLVPPSAVSVSRWLVLRNVAQRGGDRLFGKVDVVMMALCGDIVNTDNKVCFVFFFLFTVVVLERNFGTSA
jgi:hypothetical protein